MGTLDHGPTHSRISSILNRMGVDPNNVQILVTRSGSPTAIGDGDDGVILLPEHFVALMEPSSTLHVESSDGVVHYSGEVGYLSEEVRREILHREGVLLLGEEEIDYVLGHEAAHLKHSDGMRKPLAGLAAAIGTHLAIKGYNYVAWRSTGALGDASPGASAPGLWRWVDAAASKVLRGRLRPIRSPLAHCSLAVSGFIVGSFLYGQRVEREADVASASTLHLEDVAVSLTEKKIMQKLVQREQGSLSILPNGNDITEWEHPRLTKQLEYLKELEKCHVE